MTEDLVAAAQFHLPAQAELARGALEANGIDSVILTDDLPQFPGSFGSRVMVKPEDLEAARTVLSGAPPVDPSYDPDDRFEEE